MNAQLNKAAYEKLINQVIFVEENINDIVDGAMESGRFSSRFVAQRFFQRYIGTIEALFPNISVIEEKSVLNMNRLPYITLDSQFTLFDKSSARFFCHLSMEYDWDRNNANIPVYFLSAAGIDLLCKRPRAIVCTDIGMGAQDYTIGSITMI